MNKEDWTFIDSFAYNFVLAEMKTKEENNNPTEENQPVTSRNCLKRQSRKTIY